MSDVRVLEGTVLGNYRIDRLLGEGAMGEVFRATHMMLGRAVALKTLKPAVAADRNLTERFFAEARAVNIIRHENIIECTDLVLDPAGRSYIVMELLEGKTLGGAIDEVGRIPPRRAAHIVSQIADAIGAAHASGIVHRDLKPENVYLIRRAGSPDYVKVLDFGIARLRPDLGGAMATQTGVIMGTPAYMAPEQVRGEKVGPAADIYALGVILFHMLTGRLPFEPTAMSMMLVAHLTETPPRVESLVPDVPPALADLVAQALAKAPADRPADMDAFRRHALLAVGVPAEQVAVTDQMPATSGSIAAASSGALIAATSMPMHAASPSPTLPVTMPPPVFWATPATDPVAATPAPVSAAPVTPPPVSTPLAVTPHVGLTSVSGSAAELVAPPPASSKRWLWIGLGSVAALAVVGVILGFAMKSKDAPVDEPLAVVEPTPDCDRVAIHFANILITTATDDAERAAFGQQQASIVNTVGRACVRDAWSEGARRCIAIARTREAVEVCAVALREAITSAVPPPPPPRAAELEPKPEPIVPKKKVKDIVQPMKIEKQVERAPRDDDQVDVDEGGVAGGVVGGDFGGGVPAPPPPPPPPAPPQNVPPTMLEGQRIAGDKNIVPDEATQTAIAKSGKDRVVGSYKLCLSVDGTVTTVSQLKSTGFPAYDAKIQSEMRRWRYRPYMVNGKAVPVCTAVTFIYAVKDSPAPPGRTALSAGDIKQHMAAIAPRVRACYDGTQGSAPVKLTVAPSGQVTKATVGGQFAGTPVGACVEAAARGATFPAWDGPPQSFSYSFLLSE